MKSAVRHYARAAGVREYRVYENGTKAMREQRQRNYANRTMRVSPLSKKNKMKAMAVETRTPMGILLTFRRNRNERVKNEKRVA